MRIILFWLALGVTRLAAQTATEPVYKKYTWESDPKLHTLQASETANNYIILKDKILIEFSYESSGQLVMFETRHTIIHFNNEKGIEEMNKVYIPSARILEEMDLKARTITSEGKILPMSKSSVKHVDNLENSGSYIIFAMEGLDKGGEIEYMYTNKKSTNTYSYWTLQSDKIRKNVTVDIYSPENLVYEAKGYNGFADFKKDTIPDKNHIFAAMEVIPALEEEKYSAYDANKMRFEYQLAYNTARSKARLYTWDYCGNDLYSAFYTFTKPELKAIEKLSAKLKLKDLPDDESKVRALETFMKNNIGMNSGADVGTVDKMLELKYGTELTLQKIYIGVGNLFNFPVETAVTCDRMSRKFDPDNAGYNNLQDYLLYFPSIGKYTSSNNYSSRLGFPPPELTGTKAMFIKETTVGDVKAGLTKIKTVEATPYKNSYNNLTVNVSFDDAMAPVASFKQEFMGYPAYYIQPAVPSMNDDQKKELLDNLAKVPGKESVVKSSKISGADMNDVLVKPMIVESVLEIPQLLENAGAKYLFKVGELIGPQEELYQEKTRQTDGEITYVHSFTRNIEIKIPKGYVIKNPDDIKIEKKYMSGNDVLSRFTSEYTIDGDVLKIKVYEDYETLIYPKENYEQFRQVINASADFNKVVLIFEKA